MKTASFTILIVLIFGCNSFKGVYFQKWDWGFHRLYVKDNQNFVFEIGGCGGPKEYRGTFTKVRDTIFLKFKQHKIVDEDSINWQSFDSTNFSNLVKIQKHYSKLVIKGNCIYPAKRWYVITKKMKKDTI